MSNAERLKLLQVSTHQNAYHVVTSQSYYYSLSLAQHRYPLKGSEGYADLVDPKSLLLNGNAMQLNTFETRQVFQMGRRAVSAKSSHMFQPFGFTIIPHAARSVC